MKHILFLLTVAAMLLIVPSAGAQNAGSSNDTLTNADTVYVYPGGASTAADAKKFLKLGAFGVLMQHDSLSGSTAGTAVLQYSFESTPTVWYTVQSHNVNGVQGQTWYTDDNFAALSWRIRVITSGTQSTRFQSFWRFKTKPQY